MSNEFRAKNGLIVDGNTTTINLSASATITALNLTASNIYISSNAVIAATSSYSTSSSFSNTSISSSYSQTASFSTFTISASYAPSSPSVSASYSTTASYSLSASYTPPTILSTSSSYISGSNSIVSNFTGSVVLISGSQTLTPLYLISNLNNESEIVNQNLNTGATASADVVLVNASGSYLTGNYVDLGINGPGYAIPQFVGGPNDSYLFSSASNFYIGNISPNQSLCLFAGGVANSASVTINGTTNNVGVGTISAKNALDVVGNISASIITASLFLGTSSISIQSVITQSNNNTLYTITFTTGSSENQQLTVNPAFTFNPSSNTVNAFSISSSFTGSLIGTSSWASNTISASILNTSQNIILVGQIVNVAGVVPANSNFIGTNAGRNASAAGGSNMIGNFAGYLATSASNSNIYGTQAGYQATLANGSNFFGNYAGYLAISASNSNFFGYSAGNQASNAFATNCFGLQAGASANNASYSNFFGRQSGNTATDAHHSNFQGYNSGYGAASASFSNFFGASSGLNAINASNSNFFGNIAGNSATNANYSIFIGYQAGSGASNANSSIFIGKNSGLNDTINNSGGHSSILIGDSTSTGGNTDSISIGRGTKSPSAQSLNIGNTIFATGIYNSTTTSSAAVAGAKVGIGINAPVNTLDVVGNISCSVITASLSFVAIKSGSQVFLSGSNSSTPSIIISNINNFSELFIQNQSNGSSGSSDLTIANDLGNYNAGFIDVGMNSSTYADGFVGNANDGYVFSVGSGSLFIGNASQTGSLYLFAGGYAQTSSIILTSASKVGIGSLNPINKLDVVGNISCSVITASLFLGTASVSISGSVSLISTNATYYLDLSSATSGSQPTYVGSGLMFNPSTNTFSSSIISASTAFAGTASYAKAALSSSYVSASIVYSSTILQMPFSSSAKTYATSSNLFTGSHYYLNSGSTNLLYVYTGIRWSSCSLA